MENILEGNELIAKFMGWDKTEPINSTLFKESIKHTQYHRSWDWLMPVVEKIESLGYWTKIMHHTSFDNSYQSCDIKKQKPKSDGEYIYNYEGDWMKSKIECVYTACVEFIKWYNKQKS